MKSPYGDAEAVIFSRPTDDRLEQLDLSYPFRLLGVENTMRIYGALMLERRVVLTASRLSMLSAVSQTVLWLLYPFVWQHTFIPILPGCLIDVLEAPTPYLVGLLASDANRTAMSAMRFDADVMLVDLDTRTIVRCAGDEMRVLPKRIQKALGVIVEQILVREDLRPVANVAIFEAFMRMYVELFAGMPDYFVSASQREQAAASAVSKKTSTSKMDGAISKQKAAGAAKSAQTIESSSVFANDLVFEKAHFVKSIHSASIRSFVAWFCETQQFAVFVNDYLEMNNAVGRKNSFAGTQANKFINRLYEARMNRRPAPNTNAQNAHTRKATNVNASSNDVDTAKQQGSSPFGSIAAKMKRAFLKQPSSQS
jgi:hypothetical protein